MELHEGEIAAIRSLIRRSMAVYQEEGDLPAAATVMPSSHVEALDPEVPLVIGARGSGKSYWHNVLNNPEKLDFIREAYPEVAIKRNIAVVSGYSAGQQGGDDHPARESVEELRKKFGWRVFWQTILATKLFPTEYRQQGWLERGAQVKTEKEAFTALLRKRDDELAADGNICVISFDAVDTIHDTWDIASDAVRELLRLCADYRLLKGIRFKVFLRSDMANDAKVFSFPDASKLRASEVELSWSRVDLYSLLFQRLANEEAGGNLFRAEMLSIHPGFVVQLPYSKGWVIERRFRGQEASYRELFERIAGSAMAGGAKGFKRGVPFSWIVNHLLDAKGMVSPRSFCVAFYEAASPHKPLSSLPIAPKDLQDGVRAASKIRVDELKEEYPWIGEAMGPLKGKVTIPCEKAAILRPWRERKTIDIIKSSQALMKGLSDADIERGPEGLLSALESTGIVLRMPDNRFQVPDVYRVAFGLGRKGGIKPLR